MKNRVFKRSTLDKKIFVEIDNDPNQSYHTRDGDLLDANSADISEGGISLKSRYYLPKGLRVDVKMQGVGFGFSEIINLDGEIRYCEQEASHEYRCGLKFLEPSQRYEDVFGDLVKQGS